ncbi:GNAT family N-acetyltransferase [bacterium endosymbiont of Escarpia laminata]|nr:MAG: GNAT family N-acetyltransferase [bacterium endosymbiont of Escarpia laminata]
MVDPFEIKRLDPEHPRPPFNCSDQDLNEFYQQDSITSGEQLLSVTYVALHDKNVIAFFSVSNDAIKKEDLTGSRFKRLVKKLPRQKRYSSMPAVKIGRLAVTANMQRQGVGKDILDFLKVWFTIRNKTGCRFIIVDAYNTSDVTSFYEKNGFTFLIASDTEDKTRLMYFDLATFRE